MYRSSITVHPCSSVLLCAALLASGGACILEENSLSDTLPTAGGDNGGRDDMPTGVSATSTTGPTGGPMTGPTGGVTTTGVEVTSEDTLDTSTTEDSPPSACGNGVLEGDEECDEGAKNDKYSACKEDCTLAYCGDGILEIDVEKCDDGINDGSYDGCMPGCAERGPRCSDGIVQPEYELCENDDDACVLCQASACTAHCLPEFSCPPEAMNNANVVGETPAGPFGGTFAALNRDSPGGDVVYLMVAPEYVDEQLCAAPLLQVELSLDSELNVKIEVPVHLFTTEQTILETTGTVIVYENTWEGVFCDTKGHLLLDLTVDGAGWSLQGTIEAGQCASQYAVHVL